MKNWQVKKLFAIALAVIMVFSCLPISSMATENATKRIYDDFSDVDVSNGIWATVERTKDDSGNAIGGYSFTDKVLSAAEFSTLADGSWNGKVADGYLLPYGEQLKNISGTQFANRYFTTLKKNTWDSSFADSNSRVQTFTTKFKLTSGLGNVYKQSPGIMLYFDPVTGKDITYKFNEVKNPVRWNGYLYQTGATELANSFPSDVDFALTKISETATEGFVSATATYNYDESRNLTSISIVVDLYADNTYSASLHQYTVTITQENLATYLGEGYSNQFYVGVDGAGLARKPYYTVLPDSMEINLTKLASAAESFVEEYSDAFTTQIDETNADDILAMKTAYEALDSNTQASVAAIVEAEFDVTIAQIFAAYEAFISAGDDEEDGEIPTTITDDFSDAEASNSIWTSIKHVQATDESEAVIADKYVGSSTELSINATANNKGGSVVDGYFYPAYGQLKEYDANNSSANNPAVLTTLKSKYWESYATVGNRVETFKVKSKQGSSTSRGSTAAVCVYYDPTTGNHLKLYPNWYANGGYVQFAMYGFASGNNNFLNKNVDAAKFNDATLYPDGCAYLEYVVTYNYTEEDKLDSIKVDINCYSDSAYSTLVGTLSNTATVALITTNNNYAGAKITSINENFYVGLWGAGPASQIGTVYFDSAEIKMSEVEVQVSFAETFVTEHNTALSTTVSNVDAVRAEAIVALKVAYEAIEDVNDKAEVDALVEEKFGYTVADVFAVYDAYILAQEKAEFLEIYNANPIAGNAQNLETVATAYFALSNANKAEVAAQYEAMVAEVFEQAKTLSDDFTTVTYTAPAGVNSAKLFWANEGGANPTANSFVKFDLEKDAKFDSFEAKIDMTNLSNDYNGTAMMLYTNGTRGVGIRFKWNNNQGVQAQYFGTDGTNAGTWTAIYSTGVSVITDKSLVKYAIVKAEAQYTDGSISKFAVTFSYYGENDNLLCESTKQNSTIGESGSNSWSGKLPDYVTNDDFVNPYSVGFYSNGVEGTAVVDAKINYQLSEVAQFEAQYGELKSDVTVADAQKTLDMLFAYNTLSDELKAEVNDGNWIETAITNAGLRPTMQGGSIVKNPDLPQNLRFLTKVPAADIDDTYKKAVGIVLLPKALLNDAELTLETEEIVSAEKDFATGAWAHDEMIAVRLINQNLDEQKGIIILGRSYVKYTKGDETIVVYDTKTDADLEIENGVISRSVVGVEKRMSSAIYNNRAAYGTFVGAGTPDTAEFESDLNSVIDTTDTSAASYKTIKLAEGKSEEDLIAFLRKYADFISYISE